MTIQEAWEKLGAGAFIRARHYPAHRMIKAEVRNEHFYVHCRLEDGSVQVVQSVSWVDDYEAYTPWPGDMTALALKG